MICKRCRVTGRVQGVFFRDSTRKKAMEFGVNGYAKNLTDGSVEVMVSGDDQAVNALCEWLWQGPPLSNVSQVVCEESECQAVKGFVIA